MDKSVVHKRHQWMNIAFDIALSQVPNATGIAITPEQICKEYDLTEQQVVELFTLPEFVAIVKDARKRVAAMGDNAAIQLHAQILASDMQERIYRQMISTPVDMKDQLRFYESLMKYGKLDPATNGSNKQQDAVANAGNVTIVNMHIPDGIDRLGHIYEASKPKLVEGVKDAD